MLGYERPSQPHWWVQSAPAIAGGRCLQHWRWPGWLCCFNPRPPLLAGDAPSNPSPKPSKSVSIRARHCWRAMPIAVRLLDSRFAFQSAPAIAGGRCPVPARNCPSVDKFQSAPAIAGGRCRLPCVCSSTKKKFQSAPAIAGGRCLIAAWPCVTPPTFQSAPAIAGGRCSCNVTSPLLH